MKITATQLRRIIKEEVESVVGESEVQSELDAASAQWVEDNYDALLDIFSQDPQLADKVIAAGSGMNESYVSDLGRGVGDYYKGLKKGRTFPVAAGVGAVTGGLTAEIMAMIKDPSLIPFTRLRELMLDDRVTMDGSMFKAMAAGILAGHLADVAMHAKKFADKRNR